jgi:acyl dehydratase
MARSSALAQLGCESEYPINMPFNATAIGECFEPFVWDVTPRRVLAFKAALAPQDAAALDDTTPNGQAALPMMIVSPEWQVVLSNLSQPRYGLSAQERIQGVHASQDTRFHRRVLTGDRLCVRGTLDGARESRAGAVVTVRLRTEEATSGVPVAESIYTMIYRGVAISGRSSAPNALESYELPAKADCQRVEVHLPSAFCHVYSECSEIWNPIHTERTVAIRAGLSGIIVHGTALWALAGLALAGGAAVERAWLLRRLVARFHSPAYPGATLRIEHTGGGFHRLFRVGNPAGDTLVTGRAELDDLAL